MSDCITDQTAKQSIVYLIHFDQPYKHAKHYLGFSGNVSTRLHQHTLGNGARLMQVIKEAGIQWRVVRVWAGDRALERLLKLQHNSPRLCPICRQQRILEKLHMYPTPVQSLYATQTRLDQVEPMCF